MRWASLGGVLQYRRCHRREVYAHILYACVTCTQFGNSDTVRLSMGTVWARVWVLHAWQRRGTQKTRNTYNQPNRPNQQTAQTKHQAPPKGQPGRRITPNNTAAVHASAQQQPTLSTNNRQGHHQICHPCSAAGPPGELRNLAALRCPWVVSRSKLESMSAWHASSPFLLTSCAPSSLFLLSRNAVGTTFAAASNFPPRTVRGGYSTAPARTCHQPRAEGKAQLGMYVCM